MMDRGWIIDAENRSRSKGQITDENNVGEKVYLKLGEDEGAEQRVRLTINPADDQHRLPQVQRLGRDLSRERERERV